MGFRQVLVKSAKRLSLKDNSIYIHPKNEEQETVHIPLEDISIILIEDPYTVITTRLITELSKYGIIMIFCDETFVPNTQTLPFNTHYSLLTILNKQLNWSKEFKSKVWQLIIKRKIINQLEVVGYTTNDEHTKNLLLSYYNEVKPYDSDNREGIASKVFFSSLYGSDFIRFSETSISHALNYGYSVFNSTLVRHLVSMGFNTYLGIWHNSERNQFNLASDLIEPFRCIVDYYVYWNKDKITTPLPFSIRKDLINLLSSPVMINKKQCTVDYAMEVVVKSLLNATKENDSSLLFLPKIMEMDMLNYD